MPALHHGLSVTAGAELVIPDVFFTSDTVKSIADEHGATIAQVLLTWAVTKGYNVIPKSENEERMKKNLTVRPPASLVDCAICSCVVAYHARCGRHGDA